MLGVSRMNLGYFFGFHRRPIREVSCLFVTRDGAVLLESKDGIHWHFPLSEITGSTEGAATETPIHAIHRIVGEIDGIEEFDVIPEGSDQSDSHLGISTIYHLFSTTSTEQLSNLGPSFKWSNELGRDEKKRLNLFTKSLLKDHCIEI